MPSRTNIRSVIPDPAVLAVAGVLLLIAVVGTRGAIQQVGQPFSGFLLLENRIVPSVGLSIWPATADGAVFQHVVTAVDGEPVASVEEIRARVSSLPVGSAIDYVLERGGERKAVRAESRVFGLRDFVLLHGLYLLNGIALAVAAILCTGYRRSTPGASAAAPLMAIGAIWVFAALDLYGPFRLFRLHAACEFMLVPATLHMALGYPYPSALVRRRPGLVPALYAIGVAAALIFQLGLSNPTIYTASHLAAVSAFGLALVCLLAAMIESVRIPMPEDSRTRVRAVVAGALIALSLPVALSAMEAFTGGRAPQNAMALTGFGFPLSVAWAAIREVPRTSTPRP